MVTKFTIDENILSEQTTVHFLDEKELSKEEIRLIFRDNLKNVEYDDVLSIYEEFVDKFDKSTDVLYRLEFKYCGKEDIDPLAIVIEKEKLVSMNRAFNLLPNLIKRVVSMRKLETMDFWDIADRLCLEPLYVIDIYNLGLELLKYFFIYFYYVKPVDFERLPPF